MWLVGGDGEGSKDPRYLHFIPNAAIIIMVYHFNLSLAKLPPPPSAVHFANYIGPKRIL